MNISLRLRTALRAAGIHLLFSLGVAALAALLVFGLWYPSPYQHLSGGRDLFLLVTAVDVVCGPILTLVLFTPTKPRAELFRDLGLVALIQIVALAYGLYTVWQARPLYLVMEVDRFKVVSAPDLRDAPLTALPAALQPRWFGGPVTVAIREPKDRDEQQRVLFEAIQGGSDYAERPEFYLAYEGDAALKSLKRAKPLAVFLTKQPAQTDAARKLAADKGADMSQWLYLPVRGRTDWVAVIDSQARIQGFLPGDGF